ncbi:MAG TPA: type II toxin-antitoxin system RelE/ParE family toxin [Chlamydiales bacterium]|nr:type II toxin-antitoxin system RelE/ParE family toxin [Chlamydiales bacterium]
MRYTIETSENLEKILDKVPKQDVIRIRDRIRALSNDPRPMNSEKIDDNLYRVRQGNYRILYKIYDKKLVVVVVTVAHRREVYRDL